MKKGIITIIVFVILILLVLGIMRFNAKPREPEIAPPDSGESRTNTEIDTPSSGEEVETIEEDTNLVFKEGDFVLKGEQQIVIPEIMKSYEKVELNTTTLDDIKKIYGENYKDVAQYSYLTYYEYPLYNDESYVKYSIRNSDNVVIEKMVMTYSSMDSNVQLSKEANTSLVNLPEKIKDIKLGMTFDEVCSILGNE